MPSPVTERNRRYDWQDYLAWPDGERWEIIGGVAYAMSPAPSTKHQSVVGEVFAQLREKLAGSGCTPFIAPTDVRLSQSDVVQPDVLVVCDPDRIKPSHIDGPPDLIVEVLSPNTASKDLREKKDLYERSAIREYIVIDPLENYALRFVLGDDGYDKGTVFSAQENVVCETLNRVELPVWAVLDLEAPAGSATQPSTNEE